MLISEKGTYLGYATAHGVDKSSGGFPQLVIDCEATHMYDPEVEEYIEIDPAILRAWLVLYGKDQKPLFNCDAAKKVFGWDGLSFQTLAEMDISQIRFMFRVSENTYKDDGSMQIDGIDLDSAAPVRGISSLDTKDLQSLDATFGLAKVGKKTEPQKPAGKPKPPAVGKASKTEKAPKTTKPKTSKAPKTSKPKNDCAPASAPPAPATEVYEAKVDEEEKTGSTTRDDAWNYIFEQIPERALSTDGKAVAWTEAIEKIHGGPDDDTLTGEEWFKVQTLIISETIPF